MDRTGPFRWGLALAVVLVAQHTLAGEEVCRTGCHGPSQLFKYAEGTTYRYNYDGKIDITLSSAEGQVTSTEVKAVVLLTQQAECNLVLRLQNVQVLGLNGKKYGHIPDVEKPIRLNFHGDGHLEDSICTEPGDSQNSINIKRAIASLFQANLKNGHETDVFGVCPTEVAQHKEGNLLVIQKSRNLNKCAFRENLKQDFLSTAFNLNSEIKSSPILNADYNAKLKFKNGILDQASVVENYLYTPFSVGTNGAKAQVTTKLQLAGTSKDNPKVKCTQPTSIIFENPHPEVAPTSNVNTILTAVKNVVKTIDVVVGEQTAQEFVSLIKTVRVSKKADLLAVYNQVKSGIGFGDKVAAKKIYLDALLEAGTGETIEVAITLLKNNELNEVEKKLVYIGLSLVRYATESSLTTATTLLNQKDLPYEAYLGIGNLAGLYCRHHSCKKVEAVNRLTQKFVQLLADGKAANRNEENQIIYILKALANFRFLSEPIAQKVVAIAQDKKAPNRLRAAALETFLADPCTNKVRDAALHILQDIQQDSEVRIKAYLAVAQCPNAKIGNAVKALLEKEPSYQVGGFIVSHIRNIKASANPDKHLAKQHLGFTVPKKFPVDFRKWSYNGEFSYAIDTLGIAASTEANIIYSQDSFLPRSTSLNLTAEIFGHSFNFLEIQTRQENLDKLVEHYFGPKGVLRSSSLHELLKNNEAAANDVLEHLRTKLNAALRSRRDVSRSEIENIGKAVQIKENELNKDLDLDLSVKAFGSELFFTNLNLYEKVLNPEAIIDKLVEGFAKGLDQLKQFEETLRSNLLFLDVEFAYPTGLGFPLRIAVEGTSNLQVKTKGGIDIRNLEGGRDTNVKLQIIPSANIEVAGRLTLDALVVENGLKVVSTLYSSTGGDINIDLFNNRRGIDIKFGLPVQEQKLISATHEIVFHTREQAGHETNAPLKFAQAKDFSICLDQLSPFIGLTFCGEINGPNLAGEDIPVLPFPLAGAAKVAVTIENEDVSEYHFRNLVNDRHSSVELVVETIGKNKQKKVSFQVNAEIHPEKFIKAVFTSPIKSASAEARITTNSQEKSLSLRFGHDNTEFFGKIGVDISGSPNKAVYKPILEYRAPGEGQQLPVNVQGQVVVEHQGHDYKYTFQNLRLLLSDKSTYNIDGHIGTEGQDLFSDLTISNGQQSGSLKGRLHAESHQLKFNAEVKNTINPNVNFHVKGELKKQPDQLDSFLQLIHGPDLSSKTNIITLQNQIVKRYKNPQDFTIGTKNKLTYPLAGIDAKFEFEETPKSLEYEFGVLYNEVKFGSGLEIEINGKEQGDFEIEFELYGLDNQIEFKANRQVHGEESKISNELEVNGKKLEVKGTIKHYIKPSNVDVSADLTVVLPTHSTPFKVNSGLKYNPNDFDAHHKVTSGSTVVVDAFLKANKAGNANGSIKVNIKDLLVVNGHVKANKGSGSGEIVIDAQNTKKQVKIDSTFQIQPPSVYNIILNIYPSFGEDKAQKIVISTHNKVTPTNLESKNQLDFLGKKLEVNVKGAQTGDNRNSKVNGEFEVTLPNDQYLLGKLSCDHKETNELLNGQSQASIEYRKNKNASGRKASVKATYRNTNPSEALYDVQYDLAADDSNGKNINANIGFKSSKQGETRSLEIRNKIFGSIIKSPLEANLNIKGKGFQGQYDALSSYGPNAVFKVQGKYDLQGEGKPISGDVQLKLTTPSKALKTLEIGASGYLLKPHNPSDHIELRGSASLFADDDGSTPDAIIDFKGEGEVKASDKDGQISGNLKYGKLDPISAVAGYSQKETGKQKHINGNVAVQYGQGKNFKVDGTLARTGDHEYKLEAEVNTPSEEYKNTKLTVSTKRSEDNNHVTSTVHVNTDGKVWILDSEFLASDLSPLVDIKLKCPDGKLSQFYIKGNKVSDKEFDGDLKIVYEAQNFLLEGNIDANVDNVEQFFIKGNLNSPTLKINKVTFEAQNKPGKTGRRIQVTIKSAGNNLVSGSTSYQARDEHGKYVLEGSGSFKVKEETKSANFKYICQRLTHEKNKEQGIEVNFDAGLGTNAIDAEFKVTNKQFRVLSSYCEAKKECAHLEIDSKTNVNDVNAYNQEVEINVDLRKLGLSHEFGLKSVTSRKDYILDHTVDVHFQSQENNKYQYSLYIHPKEAGVSLTTPKRIIALEANANIPNNLKQGGKVSGEVAFYLDKKNHPNKKTALTGWLAIDVKSYNVNGETKLSHPGLQRPLSASIKTTVTGTPLTGKGELAIVSEFDVFAQPAQKLTISYKYVNSISAEGNGPITDTLLIQSNGLGVNIEATEGVTIDQPNYSVDYITKLKYHVGNSNYDNVFSVNVGKTQFNFLLRVLNVDLIKAFNKLTLNKEEQIVESEISSYNNNPLVSYLEIKNFDTVKYTVGFKNTPRDKLQFNSGLIPGQIADVRADHVTGSGKVNLFHATLKLDDANFFKPDYNINSKEIEKVLDQQQQKFAKYVNGLQDIGKEWSNDIRKEVTQLGELSKKAAPNLKPLKDYYNSEIQKIKNEILADKSVKEFGELFKKVFGAIAKSFGEIFAQFSGLVENVAHSLQVIFANVIESIDKDLIPQLREVAEKLTAVAADIAKSVVELLAGYLATVSQLIEKYQPEIKQLAATFGELGRDVARFIEKAYDSARAILVQQWKNIYNELKALPVFDNLRAQYEEFAKNGLPNADAVLNGIREISATIKDIVPPDFIVQKEITEIIDLTVQYLEKKVKRQPVDDFAVLERIIQINVSLVKKILGVISTPTYDVQSTDVPISLDFLKKLPKLVAVKFSPISYLLNEDTSEGVITFLLSLLNNPRQWFAPFPFFGIIVQGQHVFTFDGKHLTFPGNCKYLLARDAVNGNFTLVGTYSNGALAAITLADKHDSITLKKGGQVLLNNAATDLPARKPDLAAYSGYETIILKSTAGVRVDCTPDLIGCAVYISGFYHSQVKGLLGNGNNEPYDDFTIPNGKIVLSEGDFGNAYKIGSCQPVTVPDHAHHQDNAACNKLFSWDSELRYCYPFVKTDNFKLACAHGLSAGVKDTEEAIAKAYVAACNQHNIPVRVPTELVKCTNGDKPYSVGDKFSVKVPSKAADIVLLIDTIKSNEGVYKELLQPLVQDISKELHTKGINDIDFHLITYGGENQWPSHITVNGKLTFKGKAPNIKFTELAKTDNPIESGILFREIRKFLVILDNILNDFKLAFGLNLQARTYSEALDYPFRAHAAKSIIVLTSKPCEVGNLYGLQLLRTLFYKDNQLTLNLITPFEGSVADAKKAKDVVGFNGERVFTISQAKKKPEGSAELYKDLQYTDYCVDFTLKNRGNVFVADNFVNGKPDSKKQYIHLAAHNIVDQLTNIEQGLDCECKMINPYAARNICHEAYSKEKPARKGVAKG